MNFKLIMSSSLVVIILACTLTFAYTVYTIKNDVVANTSNNNGAAIVTYYKSYLYTILVMHLLEFALAGFAAYKS